MSELVEYLVDADPLEVRERIEGLDGVFPDPANGGATMPPGNAHQHEDTALLEH